MKKLLAMVLCLLLLTACAPEEPAPTPEPTPPAAEETVPAAKPSPQSDTAPEPAPEPVPEPQATVAVSDSVKEETLAGQIRVNITTPVFDLADDAAEDIINQYYTLLTGKVMDYAEGDLPQQITAPSPDGRPVFTVTAGYEVTCGTGNTLSVLWRVNTSSAYEMPSQTTLSAANFDTATGNLCTFSDVFAADADGARAAFVEKARQIMEAQLETNYYNRQWYDLADTALDPENFYFTETGICVFYPHDAIGTETVAELTYEELAAYMHT